ncbi:hypothetical protein A1O3_09604 [Capronia epimyces CBS 606.96]|uniref:Cell surface protein n=1 Tax=Capronia epimyces CBS 606.96 TaxID=1182542 RepID=W9XAZ1_9EURO|nr:uncharacterized protein A1O3_09604 [Capronia epimyces CBS 606.96]EXJ77378.1 hypothetical protein A1O3_09604 [Capronia epimyces CBS 606.96]
MSGLVNKAKEVLTGNKTHETTTGHTTSTHGHSGTTAHDASTLNTTHGGHTGHTGHTGGHTTGEYGHGQNTATTTTGPHSSNVANKLDPRVDSDADHRNNPTSGVGGYGGQTHASSGYGQTHAGSGYGQTHAGSGYGQTSSTGGTATAGPHSSNLANKLDPRVDSDADHRNNPTSGVGGYGGQTHASSGYAPTSSTSGTATAGPHSSNLANKLDPRVDSDADHRNNHGTRGGYGETQGSYGRPL